MILYTMLTLSLVATGLATSQPPLDLSKAVVVVPVGQGGVARKAVEMLTDEVASRTRIRWKTSTIWPQDGSPAIAVGTHADWKKPTAPTPEGFEIRRDEGSAHILWVLGNDARGVLFGVGRLLRELEMERDHITLAANFGVKTAPKSKIRGHQLGYRPKTNSYDGWTLAQWEQYIRDLAIFGINAVELIPPRSDDDADSPHFPLSQIETMIGMSRILDAYGMDVWIWYPAMDKDYSDPKTVAFAIKEWGEVFKRLPRIDAIFVPGGDPGHTQPRHLMALLEKQTENLKRHHPRAQMWVSPQSFDKTWMDEFLQIVKAEPKWLSGMVFGPQVRIPLHELRAGVPSRYPIRDYPDITHCLRCQYPVPNWDAAFAATLGREPINPRPRAMAEIFRKTHASTNGFITYSEGCNDDVNKAVWSALGWDHDADVVTILREYARYFLGPKYTETFSQALLALEDNWRGPIATNGSIETTLAQLQTMERDAAPNVRLNWRFQQALYRAYYDALVRDRSIHEADLERQALAVLRDARRLGSQKAMAEAEAILDRATTNPASRDRRARVFELAEALFQSIRMQLSVPRYQAISVGRGANLDLIDAPLNNRPWLAARFAVARSMTAESDRLRELQSIVQWTNPGPGGYYDDLGNPAWQPRLVQSPNDIGLFQGSFTFVDDVPMGRVSWRTQAIALYDSSVRMVYDNLDRSARYRLRVIYGNGPVRLTANSKYEIHPLVSSRFEILEFDIPAAATSQGKLELQWHGKPGAGGPGRGCQIAEVWLSRVGPLSR